jgi:plasmid maintenance system antidote protein VapI
MWSLSKNRHMKTGATLLRDWIARRRINQVEAAQELGFHESFISMLVNGQRMPSLDNALHIEGLTGIPVKAWSSSVHDESDMAVAGNGRNRKHNKR